MTNRRRKIMEEFEISTRLKVGIVELITRKEFDMLLNELGEKVGHNNSDHFFSLDEIRNTEVMKYSDLTEDEWDSIEYRVNEYW